MFVIVCNGSKDICGDLTAAAFVSVGDISAPNTQSSDVDQLTNTLA